jgi:hypothetical protein
MVPRRVELSLEVGDGERTLENLVLSVGAKHVNLRMDEHHGGVDGGELHG